MFCWCFLLLLVATPCCLLQFYSTSYKLILGLFFLFFVPMVAGLFPLTFLHKTIPPVLEPSSLPSPVFCLVYSHVCACMCACVSVHETQGNKRLFSRASRYPQISNILGCVLSNPADVEVDMIMTACIMNWIFSSVLMAPTVWCCAVLCCWWRWCSVCLRVSALHQFIAMIQFLLLVSYFFYLISMERSIRW